jgi:hypothetical protein
MVEYCPKPTGQAAKRLKLTPQSMEAKLHHLLADFGELES